jgi:uncharacterized repeat protein (TIGR04076 family)
MSGVTNMNKWYPEDWNIKVEVLKVSKEDKAEECRLGLEPGDTFESDYGTPNGFCPTSFIKVFPIMEVMRCEGDLRCLSASAPNKMDFIYPDGAVRFRISGIKQE